jgi:hypothetical protein
MVLMVCLRADFHLPCTPPSAQTGEDNASKSATQGTCAAQDQNAMIHRQRLDIPRHITLSPPHT